MLLFQPPFTKVCEPAAALCQLTAHLRGHGQECYPYDLNIEGFYFLIDQELPDHKDTWTRRAKKNRENNINALENIETYHSFDRYSRAVSDINRLLSLAGSNGNIELDLGNYQDKVLSPQKSDDLLHAAKNFTENIFYPFYKGRVAELIEKHSPKHIGISLNFLSQALPAFALIGFLKDTYPEIPLIVGGGLVTTWHKSPNWHNHFTHLVDHFVIGAGESPLLQLVSGKKTEVQQLPAHGELMQNRYLSPGYILPYSASVGCYWRKCSFCPETSENNPYICTPEEKVLADLQTLCKQTQPKMIHFLDSAISPRLMRALANNPPGVPWYGFARICRELTDPRFAIALKQSGCTMLKLGLETGSEQVMTAMNKGITVELASQVLQCLEEAGIATYIYLLFGTPEETLETARETLEFTRNHATAISYLNLSIFNLPICDISYPGLKTADFYEGDLSVYHDFVHPKGWGRKEVRRFLETEFKKEPSIAAIIKRNPPYFTSNHAPFMELRKKGKTNC